jgi:hypothetical protein
MAIKFELPLVVVEHDESFEIRDAKGRKLSYTYFDDGPDPTRRQVRERMTREEANAWVRWVVTAAEKAKGG